MCAKQVKKLKKEAKSKTKKSASKKGSTKKSSDKKAAAKKAAKKSNAKKPEKKAAKKSTAKKSPVSKKKEGTAKVKSKSVAKKKHSSPKAKSKSATKNKAPEKTAAPTKTRVKKGTITKKTFAGRAIPDEVVLQSLVKEEKPKLAKRKKTKKPTGPTHKNNSGAKKPIAIVKATAPKKNSRKTRYNQKELQFFKKIIDAKLEEAKSQLEFYQAQIKSIGSDPDNKLKGLEDGTTTSETEKMYSLAARQRKHIQHLENAKLRIKNNIYGVCRVTGILISKERLIAVPHATLSIQAKLKS